MKESLTTKLLSIADLAGRWSLSHKSCYRIAVKYSDILLPVKIGREYRFEPENVGKFEAQMRVVKEA